MEKRQVASVNGFLVLIGVAETDTREIADKMIKKLWDFEFLRMLRVRLIWIWML